MRAQCSLCRPDRKCLACKQKLRIDMLARSLPNWANAGLTPQGCDLPSKIAALVGLAFDTED